jgi:hypothetical protein
VEEDVLIRAIGRDKAKSFVARQSLDFSSHTVED